MNAKPNGFTLDTSDQRIVVDPVFRIEGHTRCEVNADDKGFIRNAVSTGTMWRGLEVIRPQVDSFLQTMDLQVTALFSSLDRNAARALETQYCADLQKHFVEMIIRNIRNGDRSTAILAKWDPRLDRRRPEAWA